MIDNSHAQRTDLEVCDDSVELRETREAEEDVDNIGCQFRTVFPVFTQNSRQSTDHRLCVDQSIISCSTDQLSEVFKSHSTQIHLVHFGDISPANLKANTDMQIQAQLSHICASVVVLWCPVLSLSACVTTFR